MSLSQIRPAIRAAFVVASAVLALVAVAAPAHAQPIVRVSIDFQFLAGTETMEPGDYELRATPTNVTIRPVSGRGKGAVLSVVTRLGRHDADSDPELVFDKIDGKLYISEVWVPNLDGFLVNHAPADHEHRVVGGSRPHK